jgi:hypothetical protein
MCGQRYEAPHKGLGNFECVSIGCRQYGKTVASYREPMLYTVPYTKLANDSVYDIYNDLVKDMNKVYFEKYTKSKEQDMCNSVKRWGVAIEPGNKSSDGSDTYYVRFQHKDKGTTDELTRNFDTFEQALDFVNKTYKDLK